MSKYKLLLIGLFAFGVGFGFIASNQQTASANGNTITGTYITSPYSYCGSPHTYYDLYAPGGRINITEGTANRTITFTGLVHVCGGVNYEWALWPHINFFNVNGRLSGLGANMDFGQSTVYGLGAARGSIYGVSRNVTVNTSGLGVGQHNLCFNWQGHAWHGFWDDTSVATYCVEVNVSAAPPPPPPAPGRLQITMYGPNDYARVAVPGYVWPGARWPGYDRFNMCMAFWGRIANSCTGGHVQSPNVSLPPNTYTVYRHNDIDTDGWYINKVHRAAGGPIVPDNGFGRYSFPVGSNQQVYADVHLEKYAAQCRAAGITSFRGSTLNPQPGDSFAYNFGMFNPGGITNWEWSKGVKLKVIVPPGITPINNLNGQTVGSFDWRPATRELYVAPGNYGTVYSGSQATYLAFFRAETSAAPQSYNFRYHMVFPANSPAWQLLSFGNTRFIPVCDGGVIITQKLFYPWLQTKNGDVIAGSGIIEDQPQGNPASTDSFPGARRTNAADKEASYVIMASLPFNSRFCSDNLYSLGTNPSSNRQNCRTGSYATDVGITRVGQAVDNAWSQNGAGGGTSCAPYNTSTGLPSGADLSPGCANGTIYKRSGNLDVPASLTSIQNGRATIWVTGNLTINQPIRYSYGSYSDPRTIPNLTFVVMGDVIIDHSVDQLDANIVSMNTLRTCRIDYTNAFNINLCNNKIVARGFWAANNFQFGRNFFDEGNPNANPSELILLTGQSIAFPAPGIDQASEGIDSIQIRQEENPRLN